MPHDQPPTRAETGRELKALRERADLTITAAAGKAGISQSTLSRYEAGGFLIAEEVIAALCTLYGADPDTRTWLLSGARENAHRPSRVMLHRPGDAADRQRDFGERERDSVRITSLGMTLVPGLLQTEPYMRAIVTAAGQVAGDRLEAWVANRLWRQRILTESGREFVQIVSGPALGWAATSHEIMAQQLDHLAVASRLPTVRLGVIPWGRPVDVFPLHNIDLYEKANGDRTVIVGTLGGTAVLDDPIDLDRHAALLDRLAALAAWDDEARAELARVGEWYAS